MKTLVCSAAIFLCACFGDRDEPMRPAPPDAGCPNPVRVSIDSFPVHETVAADIEVIGSLYDVGAPQEPPKSEHVSAVTGLFLRATSATDLDGSFTVAASPALNGTFAIWSATVPLSVLLEPNQGPGLVEVRAHAVLKGCSPTTVEGSSKPFNVSYAPTRPDAATDAPAADAP